MNVHPVPEVLNETVGKETCHYHQAVSGNCKSLWNIECYLFMLYQYVCGSFVVLRDLSDKKEAV